MKRKEWNMRLKDEEHDKVERDDKPKQATKTTITLQSLLLYYRNLMKE